MSAVAIVIVAAWLLWVTHPPMFTEVKGAPEAFHAMLAHQRVRLIAWAVVGVAIVAGLVTWAVLR